MEKGKSKKAMRIMVCVLIVLASGAAVGRSFFPTLPQYSRVPDFQLNDSQGNPFGLENLKGRVWIGAFFTSSCHASCSRQATFMRRLQQKMSQSSSGLEIVSFTMSPLHDTARAMNRFAGKYQADLKTWHFLTGAKSDLYGLAEKGFKIDGEKASREVLPDFIHTSRLVLVDRQGDIRGYYDSEVPADKDRLEKDLEELL